MPPSRVTVNVVVFATFTRLALKSKQSGSAKVACKLTSTLGTSDIKNKLCRKQYFGKHWEYLNCGGKGEK